MLTGSAPDSWQHAYTVIEKERPIILEGLQVSHPRCILCKWGWVGPSKHNCRRIVFIG